MAGMYPDPPGPKLALDKDGSQWFYVTAAGVVTPLTSTAIANLTGTVGLDPSSSWQTPIGDAGPPTGAKVAVVFPELRDIAGTFVAGNMLNDPSRVISAKLEYSTDSTNGQDGTWVQLVAAYALPTFVLPFYRTATAVVQNGVRAVRAVQTAGSWGANWSALHLYGKIAAGQTPDRLCLWHPTLDQELSGTAFDWGDVPRNTTSTRTFRVKNISPSKTANTSRVAMSAINEASPTNVSQHALSDDGSTWVAQVNLGNLAPGAITGVLSLRRVTLTTAQPGLWIMRVFAEATTWS
jgi:hypothetical protein